MPTALYCTPADLRAVAARIAALPCDKGQVWRVEYKRRHPVRTLPQNKLLWLWYRILQDNLGQDSDAIHEYCKFKFLPRREITIGGKTVIVAGSTKTLDIPQFGVYLESIKLWAAEEFGVYLPSPGEQGFDDMAAAYGY